MSKIALDEVEAKLLENKIEPVKVQKIIKDLEDVIEELKGEKAPRDKWEHVVVLLDPSGKLAADKMDEVVTAFVVQMKEGDNANQILSKLADAAKEQNEQAKKKKSRIDNIRDLFGALKAKFVKPKHIRIKTKEAVRVLLTNGNLQ